MKKISQTVRRFFALSFFATKFFLAFFCLEFFSCKKNFLPQTQMIFHTPCSVNLFEDASAELYAEIFFRLRQIENTFNNFSSASEISFVNANAAKSPVKVSGDFCTVLKTALDFCELSGGAFDVTVGPLTKLWGFAGKNPQVPREEDLQKILPLVNYKNVVFDFDAATVRFLIEGIELDLGAIAKGFAADEVEKILQKKNVRRAVVSLGGNVFVHGKKSARKKWQVAIQNPFGEGAFATLFAEDESIVTSGGYERFFEKDGVRYSHILNPATGFPVQTKIASVTIISKNSMLADALSTSVFVCGTEKIAAFRQSKLCGNFECVVIFNDGKIFATEGAAFLKSGG